MKGNGKTGQVIRYDLAALKTGLASQFTARVAVASASLVVAILYVRLLSPGEYAAYAAAIAMAGLLVQLTSTGLERLVFRYAPAAAEAGVFDQLARFFNLVFAARMLTMLFGAGLTSFLWHWLCLAFGLPHELLPLILLIALAQTLVAHWLTVTQVLMQQRAIAFSVSTGSAVKLFLASGLALFLGARFSTAEALVALAVAEVLTGIMLGYQHWYFMRRNRHGSKGVLTSNCPPSPGEAVRFVVGNYGMTQLSAVIHPRVQILVASAVLPDAIVAGYAFVRNLVEQLAGFMPSRAFRQLFEPMLMGRYRDRKNESEIGSSLSLLTKANLAVVTPIALLFAIGGSILLGLVTGGKYVEQSSLLALLLFGLVLSTYRTSVGVLVNATGNVSSIVLAAFLGAALVALLLWWPLSRGGVWLLGLSELVYTAGFLLVIRAQDSSNHAGFWAPLRLLASAGALYGFAIAVGISIDGITAFEMGYAFHVVVWGGSVCVGLVATRWLCTCTPLEIDRVVAIAPGFLKQTVRRVIRQRPRM